MDLHGVGGTALDNAVAIGQVNGGGVLVEFKGASAAPAVRVFPPTQISELNFLWFDGTHGMGVGVGNEVVIRRDGGWTTEYHPSFEALLSVIGDGAGGFTVVGDLGSIYKWDPARRVWDSLFDTRLAVKLDAAQLVDFTTGEAWAVGGNRLWHFVGTGWVPEALPASPALVKATTLGVFDSRIFVGGTRPLTNPVPSAVGVVLVRSEGTIALDAGVDDAGVPLDGGTTTGTIWNTFPLRGLQAPRGIFGQGQQGRVVGDFGALWKWNPTTATLDETSKGFQGDVADIAVTDTDLFAAVNECNDVRCLSRHGTVMHRTATGYEALGTFPSTETVWAIVARADNEVIVTSDTRVWMWNGASWTEVPTGGLGGPMLALAWCGGDLWGTTATGTVYRGGTTALQVNSTPAQGPLWSIHCPVAGEIWIAGEQFLASRTGNTGAWQQRTSDSVNQAPWQAVWSPGTGEAFAFGDALFGVYWDTQDLILQDATGPIGIDVATAMWGNKIDNLYMAGLAKLPGAFGFMLRFDGINWSLVDPGAHRKGTALVGKSNNEIWLGTEGGGVLKAVPPP
jgi:hypothetical protein